MPSKYILKEYVSDGIYHVYNRGVEKRDIFIDEHDYNFFLFLIKSYILPINEQKINNETRMQKGAFHGRVEILAYALMPNHYHLLIKHKDENDLSEFMRALMTSYVSYFNKKHSRTGPLFQGRYKAILVTSDEYLLHLSRYIHLNPIATRTDLVAMEQSQGPSLLAGLTKHYTSYAEYLNSGGASQKWLNPSVVLDYFAVQDGDSLFSASSYQSFVEDSVLDESDYLGVYSID